ncbi:MAG: hypothetical protein K2W82_04290 [Candidatus Obscuribacterales bacterium]|nr:hypothetical protein [Candidatus Obscuribacterales bacterium]
MSYGQDRRMRNRDSEAGSLTFPFELELVAGFLKLKVQLTEFNHHGEEIKCWTMLSDGFAATGQKEISLTLQMSEGQQADDFPKDILDFYKKAYEYALSGLFVDPGSISEFSGSGFLSAQFKALGYIESQSLGDWQPPPGYMAAVLLTANEYEAAKLGGLSRALALLGKNTNYYPCPSWNSLTRSSAVDQAMLDQMRESQIAGIHRMIVRASSATKKDNQLELVLPAHARPYFSEFATMDENTPLCLLVDHLATAESILVWNGINSAPQALTKPGTKADNISGAFLCFIPSQSHDCGYVVEDGFALSLTPSSWSSLRQALAQGSDFNLTANNDGLNFSLRWSDYISPASRSREASPPECHDHEEDSSSEMAKVPAYAHAVHISTDELVVQKAIGLKKLKTYIEHLEDLVRDHFFCQGEEEGFKLLLRCQLNTNKETDFVVESYPPMAEEDKNDLLDRLSLSFAPTASAPIKFDIEFNVWGGNN